MHPNSLEEDLNVSSLQVPSVVRWEVHCIAKRGCFEVIQDVAED